jgi:hypothetical protein
MSPGSQSSALQSFSITSRLTGSPLANFAAVFNRLVPQRINPESDEFLGFVNIYDKEGHFLFQANTFADAAQWLWEKTGLKRKISNVIGLACRANGTAYGFKFTRTKEKNRKS